MNRQQNIDTRISKCCLLSSTNEKDMELLGSTILTVFRDACRSNRMEAEDMADTLCFDSMENEEHRMMKEALVRLEFFATESERISCERGIDNIFLTARMLDVMEAIRIRVQRFPGFGPAFASIISMCYIDNPGYSEEYIYETLGMSKSNYYRHKRRAIIVFGLMFRAYREEHARHIA